MNENCPFCHKDIKEISFMESKSFFVIYNRAPILPGHSMIIPRRHYTSILELTDEERHEMMDLGVEAIKGLRSVFQTNSFNWTLQEGESAGQTVAHLHVHLLPRHSGDLPQPGDWYPLLENNMSSLHIDSQERPAYNHEQLARIAKHIKQTMKHLE